jgi:hypothetical protein
MIIVLREFHIEWWFEMKRFLYANRRDHTDSMRSSGDGFSGERSFGNPSCITQRPRRGTCHSKSRAICCRRAGAQPDEIFLSVRLRADNWAIKGTAAQLAAKGKSILLHDF